MGRLIRIIVALALLALYGLPAISPVTGTASAHGASHAAAVAIHATLPVAPGDEAKDHAGDCGCMPGGGIVALAADAVSYDAPYRGKEGGAMLAGLFKERAVAPDPHPPKRA